MKVEGGANFSLVMVNAFIVPKLTQQHLQIVRMISRITFIWEGKGNEREFKEQMKG
jgi:hypothetical protein